MKARKSDRVVMEANLENLLVMTEAVDDSLATLAALNITQRAALCSLNSDLEREEVTRN